MIYKKYKIGDSHYLGREIKEIKTFKLDGTFESLYEALSYINKKGYKAGSLCYNQPIALVYNLYNIPQKWKNIPKKDINLIDGVLLSPDFREDFVMMLLF